MRVEIPFQERWRDLMLTGKKTMTSRTKRYGQEGDTFKAFGATFKIYHMGELPLHMIAAGYYLLEGCVSPADFEHVWWSLHPRKGFVDEQVVFCHFFRILP